MDSNDLFNTAYDLHYKTKDLESACAHYQRLILEFPDSKEARIAKAQLRRIELTVAEEALIAPPPIEETQISSEIIVTTGDLQRPYEVIGPVYFQISNKGIFSSQLDRLKKQYKDNIEQMRRRGQVDTPQVDWGFIIGEWSVGQSDFELAFYIAVQELKKRAAMLDADAIIGMRQDIDLDTNAFTFFYLQMYGTAVKFA